MSEDLLSKEIVVSLPVSVLRGLNVENKQFTIPEYMFDQTEELFRKLAEDIALRRELLRVYEQIRRKSCIPINDLHHVEGGDYAYSLDRALNRLYVAGLIHYKEVNNFACVILGPPSPDEHPKGLKLYEIDMGVTYWVIEEEAPLEEIARLAEKQICEVEGVTNLDELDEEPLNPERDVQHIDHVKGLHRSIHLDGTPEDPAKCTLWYAFCREKKPGVLACSEW